MPLTTETGDVAALLLQQAIQFSGLLGLASTSHLRYNYHNSGRYPSACLLFKTQLNSIGLSVPQMKHITFPLRAQQVNALYRFVTMVY
jgi:hypothetical protein